MPSVYLCHTPVIPVRHLCVTQIRTYVVRCAATRLSQVYVCHTQEAEVFTAWLGALQQVRAQAEKERLEAEEEEAEVGPQLPGVCVCVQSPVPSN